MLVVGPNSTCDVCLECYTSGANVPHAITCGHVFCQKCLGHLAQHKCPLCRQRFSPQDIRKLHVDRDPSSAAINDSIEPSAQPPPVDDEAQRLLDDIARIVKEGAKIHDIRRVIDESRAYYKSQPGNQYTPVRVGCLLLHNVAESQRKLQLQAEQIREITTARDEIRERLTSELDAADLKYQELQRTSRDEKETALAIEKSLREHYDRMNDYWKGQLETAKQESQALRNELDRLRSAQSTFAPPRPLELRYFYNTDTKRSSPSTEDLSLSKVENHKGKVIDDDFDFHLSPLADATAPLASTAPSLLALTYESDEEDLKKQKPKEAPIQEEPEPDSDLEQYNVATPMAYPLRQPHPSADPIPIPSRATLSRQTSAGSVAMSITADHWQTGISGSKPRDDVVMSSRPPSPSRRHSTDRQGLPQGPRPRDSYVREMTEIKRKDSYEMTSKDQFTTWHVVSSGVSKLHDLLDSPQPSSFQGHVLHRSEFPEPALSRPTSRPSAAPSRPSSTSQHPSSTSLTPYDDLHGAPTERKTLVRASEVAMQLERERLEKLEKERRRLRDSPPTPNSLKDTTNAPADTQYRDLHRRKSTTGKMKATYPTVGEAYV
ncbi:hypothetical protein HYDPIDRAFT_169207 [Hydnomerulius pinastri MD-312]|uniref:RING-type domain-containing protein n=1 Tax=Hydnomerulius pinastri MD-312 TaxID=994086 RepID=A0A0C9WD98_9AGAM|nr:hypothetical protein HYDPIDRAFT_169207 [Hydnomerulius pinastri MD-312]